MARRAKADDAVPGRVLRVRACRQGGLPAAVLDGAVRGLRARARRQGGIAGASRPILPPGCRGRCLSLVCSPRAAAPTLALGRPIETRAGPFRTPDRVRHGVSARGRTLRKAVPLHVPPAWEMSTDHGGRRGAAVAAPVRRTVAPCAVSGRTSASNRKTSGATCGKPVQNPGRENPGSEKARLERLGPPENCPSCEPPRKWFGRQLHKRRHPRAQNRRSRERAKKRQHRVQEQMVAAIPGPLRPRPRNMAGAGLQDRAGGECARKAGPEPHRFSSGRERFLVILPHTASGAHAWFERVQPARTTRGRRAGHVNSHRAADGRGPPPQAPTVRLRPCVYPLP